MSSASSGDGDFLKVSNETAILSFAARDPCKRRVKNSQWINNDYSNKAISKFPRLNDRLVLVIRDGLSLIRDPVKIEPSFYMVVSSNSLTTGFYRQITNEWLVVPYTGQSSAH